MADHPLRIVVRCEAHQPYDYFVGLVLCSFMDYADVRLRGVHRHPADLVLHQTKTPNPLTPEPMTIETLKEAQYHYDFIQKSEETLEHISAMQQKRKVVISGLSNNPQYVGLGYPTPIEIDDKELVDLIFKKVIENIEVNLAVCEAHFNQL